MRVNVYSQDVTGVVEVVEKQGTDGQVYTALQVNMHSADLLHADDQSAVTFWLPRSAHRREVMAAMFEEMATLVRASRDEVA